MIDSLSKAQRLFLFRLLFTGETPLQSKVDPLKVKERNQLVRLGLVVLQANPSGRGKVVVLSDGAWEWAAANLESELMISKHATRALEGVLRRLNTYLQARSMSLQDLFQPSDTVGLPSATPGALSDSASLHDRIRSAYLTLTGGRHGQPVRLAQLKARLGDISFQSIDAALLNMQRAGDLSLQTLEDPLQLSDADHRAAIRIVGQDRHLVYLEK